MLNVSARTHIKSTFGEIAIRSDRERIAFCIRFNVGEHLRDDAFIDRDARRIKRCAKGNGLRRRWFVVQLDRHHRVEFTEGQSTVEGRANKRSFS